MAATLFKSRVLTGFGSKTDGKSLESSLKRATSSEKVDVDKADLLAIAQSTHHEEDRRLIMRHVSSCLMDTSSAKWRCINAGLVVLEHLLLHGSLDLVTETASGMHFDLVQRLSFLEKFEYSFDKRVEGMIRRRALSIRGLWLEKQQQALEAQEAALIVPKPVVFHTEDTDDDLSDTELESSAKAPPLSAGKICKIDNLLEESTTDGESSPSRGPSPRSSPSALDLLSISETPRATPEETNLLDM